jgi:hypothetical protein
MLPTYVHLDYHVENHVFAPNKNLNKSFLQRCRKQVGRKKLASHFLRGRIVRGQAPGAVEFLLVWGRKARGKGEKDTSFKFHVIVAALILMILWQPASVENAIQEDGLGNTNTEIAPFLRADSAITYVSAKPPALG